MLGLCSKFSAALWSDAPPNKRLKLTGAIDLNGIVVLCPGARELSFNYTASRGRVACSLSAIR